MATKIENLVDDSPIPRQSWVLLSFLSPEGIKNCTLRGLKVRGVFETRPEAEEYAKKLRDSDPNFDIHVGEVGKWLPWDPEPSSYSEVNYPNEKLDELMKARNEQLEKSKLLQQQIKADKLKEAETSNENPHEFESRKEKIQNRLKKKVQEKNDVSKDNVKPQDTSEQIKSPESKSPEPKLSEPASQSNMTVHEKLDRIKQLYSKYKKN